MNDRSVRSLWLAWLAYAVFPALPVHAGWINGYGETVSVQGQTAPAPAMNPNLGTALSPLTRGGFAYLNDLGGGVDTSGNYQRPFPSVNGFGVVLADGRYYAPADWTTGLYIIFDVQGGFIHRCDFYIYEG